MTTNESSGWVIGCDVGTQSAKGVLVAAPGAVGQAATVVATATAGYSVAFPAPQWAQQDASDWIAGISDVVRSLADKAPGHVTHIAVSAQVDGVVAVDDSLTPMCPALIWMDRRAVAQSRAVEEVVGRDEIYALTGLTCDAAHAGPKMRWLLDHLHEPPRYLLPPAALLTGWLTGEMAQDHANASSTMLYDITIRDWSSVMLDAFGFDVDLLPRVVDATEELGQIRRELAESLGLGHSCRVVAGTGDDHGGAVGGGAVRPGVVIDITGTAEPIGTTTGQPVFDPERLVEPHAHAVPDMWFIENGGFVSGGSVLWVSRLLGRRQSEVVERAANTPAGSNGLVFVPALSGAMTPRWNAVARGSFTGLTMEHGADDLGRAVLEGCAFAARDVVDGLAALGLPVDEVRVTGGGARSSTLLQLKADVLGRPVRAIRGEASAIGAACLAAVAAGWFPDVPTAADSLVQVGQRFEPDPSTASAYESGYRCYREVFDALEPTYGVP